MDVTIMMRGMMDEDHYDEGYGWMKTIMMRGIDG